MDNKFSRSPFTIIILAGAAVIGLVTTIVLILTNPSHFPQGINKITPQVTPQIFIPEEPSTQGEQKAVARAKEELAKKLGILSQNISVSAVESTTWPDSSLGCPRPGFFYAQVLTPGYKVVLDASGQTYDYHLDTSERIVLCKQADNQ